jgi:hypothetical protein
VLDGRRWEQAARLKTEYFEKKLMLQKINFHALSADYETSFPLLGWKDF